GLEGEVAADEGKTLTQLNRALDHYINDVPFEPHYPLPRFNRKADSLLVEQCGMFHELLMPASREAIVDNIRWNCPSGRVDELYAAVESGNIQFRMERKAQNVRFVEVTFDDVTYDFEIEVVTDF
ncbi:MAG: hypothetical protein N2385_14395, partial [Chloroflexus sp.]|nr:hypothetical protein [Chloroflexus sp.]